MPKSKRGPSLFELLSADEREASEALKVPPWWTRRGRSIGADAVKSETVPEITAAKTLPEPPTPPDTLWTEDGPAGPFFEMNGDRIRISLTSKLAAVAVFAVILLLTGVFAIGSWFGEQAGRQQGYQEGRESFVAPTVDEIEMARAQPPATNLIADLLETTPDDAVAQPGDFSAPQPQPSKPSRWREGYTYLVVQDFRADRLEDAHAAQHFLTQHGFATELVRYPAGATKLITIQGYDREDSAQKQLSDRLLTTLHAVGAKFYADGGGYKLEGYFWKATAQRLAEIPDYAE